MRKRTCSLIVLVGIISAIGSCHEPGNAVNDKTGETHQPLREHVITADEQKAMTADKVIQDLKDGNARYCRNELTANDNIGMLHGSLQGQYPEAFILSCIDSRVPVEEIFDKGIGDLFVGRIAGNFVDEDILGSMEYGCKVSGARLILVLGHESCGAIKAAIEHEQLGNITAMLAKIKPALIMSESFKGEHTVSNHAYVDFVVQNNVRHTIQDILLQSPVLKKMADDGELRIVGAYYSLETGKVVFL